MKKLMVCFDGSERSQKALELAINHSKAFVAELFVVISTNMRKSDHAQDVRLIEELTAELTSAQAHCEQQGVTCKTHLSARGKEPSDDLTQLAEENDVSHIYMAPQKKSKLETLVMCSVTQEMILRSNRPIVVVV